MFIDFAIGIPVENLTEILQLPSVATVSTDSPSNEPLVCNTAFGGHFEITISLNIHAMILSSGKTT
jgi:hypothetical protein